LPDLIKQQINAILLHAMNLLFTSDLHGYDKAYSDFVKTLKEGNFDLGVLGGDLMTFPSDEELKLAKRQLESEKAELTNRNGTNDPQVIERALINKQNYYKRVLRDSGKPIVFVMGNDDGILGSGSAWVTDKGIVDINQRRAKLGKYSFVGYHYTSPFVGGTFEKTEDEQEKDFRTLAKLIDENTVLITHGPPWGILDTASDGKNVGSKALRYFIETRPPRLHLFGHIHRTFGIQGICANGAYPASRKFISADVKKQEMKIIGFGKLNNSQ
jgi:Icc-related predicted phosphoesterase